jgi:hypothetical protein
MRLNLRSVPVLAIALLTPSTLVQGFDAASTARADKVVASVKERLRAISQGDREVWSRLTAEDAVLVNDDGSVKNKAAVAASFPPTGQDVLSDVRDAVVRDVGAAVVVTYLVHEVETFASSSLESTLRRTEVWVSRDGHWQAVSTQGTFVPTMHWNVVTLEPKLLDEYAGRYEWSPGHVDTVTREDGRLYSSFAGESERDELFATGDATFFARDDFAFVSFVRGPGGRITHYVYRRPDGQSVLARRLE